MHELSDVVSILQFAFTMETADDIGNHGNLKIFNGYISESIRSKPLLFSHFNFIVNTFRFRL